MQSFAAVVIFVVCCSLPKIDSLGSFEIRLISFLNGTRKEFRPEFRLCLKEYQKIISHNGACTFGETTIDGERLKNGTRIDFEFAWPQSFTLITETWRNNGKVKDLIFHDGFQEEGVPSSTEWSEKTLTSGNGLIMRIAYRVVCGQYYYGPKCITFCRPRSNSMGNFECTENGTMRCMTGWEGKSCDIAQCDRCLHGFCEKPGVCRCKSGWTGDRCDQCVTYPGCKHGRCNVPNECICYVGWGGHFCNEDLNYCTSHSPCRNGATCRNTGHGQYTCECVNGYSGVNCENLAENCSPNTCLNDGVCRDMGNNYTCECPRGFSGRHCEYAVQSCGELPCHNGGTCRPMWPEGFVCICPPGWAGKHCNLEVNPCHNQICQNGGKCIERYSNDVRKYECICPAGFTGNNCEHKAVECALLNPCQNGGRCIDEINNYKCECPDGFSGALCQYSTNACSSNPCMNGAHCIDLRGNNFRCRCPPGFRGIRCETEINECASEPCRNGGQCEDLINHFRCICRSCYSGPDCSIFDANCDRLHHLSPTQPHIHSTIYDHPGDNAAEGIKAPFLNEGIRWKDILLVGTSVGCFCFILAIVVLLYRKQCVKHSEIDNAVSQNDYNTAKQKSYLQSKQRPASLPIHRDLTYYEKNVPYRAQPVVVELNPSAKKSPQCHKCECSPRYANDPTGQFTYISQVVPKGCYVSTDTSAVQNINNGSIRSVCRISRPSLGNESVYEEIDDSSPVSSENRTESTSESDPQTSDNSQMNQCTERGKNDTAVREVYGLDTNV